MNKIRVIKAGLISTIQDGGRSDFQKIGMPVGGAMDIVALKMANYLAGNNPLEAAIEMTMTGCCIEFYSDSFIGIVGAMPELTLNSMPIEPYRTIQIKAGDVLDILKINQGARTYLSIAGGFDLPDIMGSKSTYLYGKLGGFNGRVLKDGDIILINQSKPNLKLRRIKVKHIPQLPTEPVLRILPGPEKERFTWNGLANFLTKPYSLSPHCDRMGFRLDGPAIEHLNNDADIISSPIAFGTIQVPSHGSPIIMMADRQTTGGYTRIANVITADYPILAQLKPGDKIRFKEVSYKTAIKALKAQEKIMKKYS
ncbi:biotin-dependent carboxyltransferase family protein [Carboxylicivirga caseinilyticus]|uniref:5-oxoprolinase subunit C family protein n=1 Tax=Carboxylicivirga caseinilyticus TaxID=3417572 RepID=UPI003D32D805|nr:biotin-dependent carboxyltransferase [Marinilabiliaceae bacterium A049]